MAFTVKRHITTTISWTAKDTTAEWGFKLSTDSTYARVLDEGGNHVGDEKRHAIYEKTE